MAEHVEWVIDPVIDREAHELAYLNLWLRVRRIQDALKRLAPPGPRRHDPFASRRTTLKVNRG